MDGVKDDNQKQPEPVTIPVEEEPEQVEEETTDSIVDGMVADLKYANSSIKANVDIAYGFFKTPLDALEAFESEIEKIHKAATKSVNKELRRLEKCAAKLRKMKKEGVENDL